MLSLFKAINASKPMLKEFSSSTVQRIKEGEYLIKSIRETQTASRKCDFYAKNAFDKEISEAFAEEAKLLKKGARILEKYYESMTKE